ncbi:MAG TPA: peptide chain release factor-like protein [Rhabdochlamydiaceae bacterium]|jgi:protein subunit release factor B|nr:peptide chain release factor-like protein [Rhabdochlamydiaceae bacterium]
MITKEKMEALHRRLEALGIHESDLIEKFILGSGSGGQKINKTSSCVYLKHIPTGIEVKCQQDRSRELNRYIARRELCDRFEAQIHNVKSEKQQQMEKIRRQKRRRSRRSKDKMLTNKKHHGEKKNLRQSPSSFE